jgi:transporter family protein
LHLPQSVSEVCKAKAWRYYATRVERARTWWAYALLSAAAAAVTAISAKLGVADIPAALATALRTLVVALLVWALVLTTGEHRLVRTLNPRAVAALALSGLATGVSWLAYVRALQLAPVSAVAPIDKLGLPLTVALAWLVLGETVSPRAMIGVLLMVAGALLTRS